MYSLPMWLALLVACFLTSIAPGIACMTVVSTGMTHGLARGIWIIGGLQLGNIVQLLLIAFGVGPLFLIYPEVLGIVKVLGSGYIAYLGLRLLFFEGGVPSARSRSSREVTESLVSPWRLVLRGLVVNTTNVKSLVFLLAFVPHFVFSGESLVYQYGIIMGTLVFVDMVMMVVYMQMGAALVVFLHSSRNRRILDQVFGIFYLLIATVLLVLHIR